MRAAWCGTAIVVALVGCQDWEPRGSEDLEPVVTASAVASATATAAPSADGDKAEDVAEDDAEAEAPAKKTPEGPPIAALPPPGPALVYEGLKLTVLASKDPKKKPPVVEIKPDGGILMDGALIGILYANTITDPQGTPILVALDDGTVMLVGTDGAAKFNAKDELTTAGNEQLMLGTDGVPVATIAGKKEKLPVKATGVNPKNRRTAVLTSFFVVAKGKLLPSEADRELAKLQEQKAKAAKATPVPPTAAPVKTNPAATAKKKPPPPPPAPVMSNRF